MNATVSQTTFGQTKSLTNFKLMNIQSVYSEEIAIPFVNCRRGRANSEAMWKLRLHCKVVPLAPQSTVIDCFH